MKIKQVTVTFDFDPVEQVVSKLTCFVDGVERKKQTTKRVSNKPIVLEDEAIITREANRLVFNNKAFADMNLSNEDRIIIKYEKLDNIKIPVIGTDTAFNEEGSGNKVTKAQTISYRGKVNTILSEFGTEFKIESYKGNLWRLSSDENKVKTYEELDTAAENIDIELLTKGDSIEIDKLPFKL